MWNPYIIYKITKRDNGIKLEKEKREGDCVEKKAIVN